MKRRIRRALEHLAGPVGSLLLHLLVVAALVRLVFFETGGSAPEIEVIMMEPETADLDDIRRELRELEQIEAVPAVTPPMVALADLDVPPPEVEATEGFSEQPTVDFAALDVVDTVQSPLVLRGVYSGRTEAGRRKALGAHAGRFAVATEAAVIRALEWLKEHQEPAGSWSEGGQRGAMTGLALLTFLAHGETPSAERYGPTVERAIRFLLADQQPNGRFASCGGDAYAHGIVTYALAEAYALTQIPAIRDTLDPALRVIVDGQMDVGGWAYGYNRQGRRDTSVSGWQVQALKAAHAGGAVVPGLTEAMEKAVADLKSVQAANGRFGYGEDPGAGSIGMTGVGVLCLQLLGYASEPEVARGLQSLDAERVAWDLGSGWNLYGWYYVTQAKFHAGRAVWRDWNAMFARAYTDNQNPDGSWTAPGETESSHGPVYATTLAALSLQVYYRLLPTYQASAVEPVRPPAREDEDIVRIL